MKNYHIFIGTIIIGILLIAMGIKLYYQHNSNNQNVQIQARKTTNQTQTKTTHHKAQCKATQKNGPFKCSHIS